MDAAAFEQVYGSFRDFHAYFAPLFGRRETREHSGHYLQALLVQSGERRNAENLSETVPGSARGMQRFLTDSPWDDEVIIGRLQEYLGTRLEHPEGVWALDGSDFPKQGRKSVGVHPVIGAADGATNGNGDELALEMVGRAQERGHPRVCAAWCRRSWGRPTPRSIRLWVT